MNRPLSYTVFQTEAGWMAIMASERGLVRTTLPQPSPEEALKKLGEHAQQAVRIDDRFTDLKSRLQSYFRGGRHTFPDKLDIEGTPFQHAVWDYTYKIPYGSTKTYGELAEEIGSLGAARAVGQAMKRNPVPIVIPCHRVVASGGKLGGFAGRPELKWALLSLEAADSKHPPQYP